MSRNENVHFVVQLAGSHDEAREADDLARELLNDIRESRLASVYRAPLDPEAQGASSTDRLSVGTLRVAVEPLALPRFLEFVHLWALRRERLVVRIKLQVKVRRVAGRPEGPARCQTFTLRGRDGQVDDVDDLMESLETEDDVASVKLVDFALGLVKTEKGKERIRHYLFDGTLRQRNYAALYFKRLGERDALEEAVRLGRVSAEQAFSE